MTMKSLCVKSLASGCCLMHGNVVPLRETILPSQLFTQWEKGTVGGGVLEYPQFSSKKRHAALLWSQLLLGAGVIIRRVKSFGDWKAFSPSVRVYVCVCGWTKKYRKKGGERKREKEREKPQSELKKTKKKTQTSKWKHRLTKFQIDVYDSSLCSASCPSRRVTGDTWGEDREPDDKAAER